MVVLSRPSGHAPGRPATPSVNGGACSRRPRIPIPADTGRCHPTRPADIRGVVGEWAIMWKSGRSGAGLDAGGRRGARVMHYGRHLEASGAGTILSGEPGSCCIPPRLRRTRGPVFADRLATCDALHRVRQVHR
jgi:hypothetical protein